MPSVTKFKDLSISFTRNKITNDLLVKKEDAAVKRNMSLGLELIH